MDKGTKTGQKRQKSINELFKKPAKSTKRCDVQDSSYSSQSMTRVQTTVRMIYFLMMKVTMISCVAIVFCISVIAKILVV